MNDLSKLNIFRKCEGGSLSLVVTVELGAGGRLTVLGEGGLYD